MLILVLGVAMAAVAGCGSAAPPAPPAPAPAPAPSPAPAPVAPTWTPDARKIYVTVGHGEITSYDSVPPELKGRIHERGTSVLVKRLGKLGYELQDLGPLELVRDVPKDATIVLVLGPSAPLQPAEWDALARYLDRGGRLAIALDPLGAPGLGSLEGKLGVRFNPAHLTDDRSYMPMRGTAADHRLIVTAELSAHPSAAQLLQSNKGMVLIDAGALEEVPFTSKGAAPRRTVTIRSPDSSWLDLDDDLAFDDRTEQRLRWNLAAAIEAPGGGFRALVFADADLFTDTLIGDGTGPPRPALISGPLLEDAVRWLVGE